MTSPLTQRLTVLASFTPTINAVTRRDYTSCNAPAMVFNEAVTACLCA